MMETVLGVISEDKQELYRAVKLHALISSMCIYINAKEIIPTTGAAFNVLVGLDKANQEWAHDNAWHLIYKEFSLDPDGDYLISPQEDGTFAVLPYEPAGEESTTGSATIH